MKATVREILSLAGITLTVPVFVLTILVGARAVALENDLLLLALALAGAVVSGINGFGRRTATRRARATQRPRVTEHSVAFPSWAP